MRNAPEFRFDNRMALEQMSLIDCLANMQGKQQIWYGRKGIFLARNSVTGLFSWLRINTHTPERPLYQIQESDLALKVIQYRVNQAQDMIRNR